MLINCLSCEIEIPMLFLTSNTLSGGCLRLSDNHGGDKYLSCRDNLTVAPK